MVLGSKLTKVTSGGFAQDVYSEYLNTPVRIQPVFGVNLTPDFGYVSILYFLDFPKRNFNILISFRTSISPRYSDLLLHRNNMPPQHIKNCNKSLDILDLYLLALCCRTIKSHTGIKKRLAFWTVRIIGLCIIKRYCILAK